MSKAKKGDAEETPNFKKGAARFARVKNTLKMGLVGLPNVGKSSSFNLLCKMSVPVCTIAHQRCPRTCVIQAARSALLDVLCTHICVLLGVSLTRQPLCARRECMR